MDEGTKTKVTPECLVTLSQGSKLISLKYEYLRHWVRAGLLAPAGKVRLPRGAPSRVFRAGDIVAIARERGLLNELRGGKIISHDPFAGGEGGDTP